MSIKQGNNYIAAGGGTGAWGSITGTLSDQTDLNTALENKANDSDVVKLTGNQVIYGMKGFENYVYHKDMIEFVGGTYSTNPSNPQDYGKIGFADSTGKKTAVIGNYSDTSGTNICRMVANLPTDNTKYGELFVAVNSSGDAFTYAPTPATSDNSSQIATTAFVKAQGYVTSSGTVEKSNSVINQRDSSTVVKTWTGTKAQYDAIVTKDANTLYNITDDTDVSLTILEALYPVGSVYITTAASCPLSALISGSTWELVSSGRVLQGADSGHSAGTTIEAGLPNITGSIEGLCGQNATGNTKGTGAFTGAVVYANSNVRGPSAGSLATFPFDAANSNSIYGNSSTVQPPAYVVNIYRRIA